MQLVLRFAETLRGRSRNDLETYFSPKGAIGGSLKTPASTRWLSFGVFYFMDLLNKLATILRFGTLKVEDGSFVFDPNDFLSIAIKDDETKLFSNDLESLIDCAFNLITSPKI